MGKEKVAVELSAETKEAEKKIDQLNKKIKDTGKTAKKTGKEISAGMQLGEAAARGLDRYTGGLASKLVAVGKAAKLSGKAMKTALISTGIGALVVALGLVVQYWDDITELVNGVSGEQKDLLANTEKTLQTQEDQLETIGQMSNTLKLQGKSEKEIRDLKKQQTDEIITSTQLLLEQQKSQKKAQVEAAERNKSIAMGIITFLTAPIVMILGVVDALSTAMASLGIIEEATNLAEGYVKGTAELLFDPEEVETKGDETIAATEEKLRQLKNTRDGFELQDKADAKKSAEEKKQDEIQAEKDKNAAIESIRKQLIDTEDEERAEKLRKIGEDYDEQIRLAEKYYGEDSEKVLELRAARKTALDEQEAEFKEQDKERKEAEDEAEKQKRAQIDAEEAKRLKDKEDAEKEAAEKKYARNQKALDDLITIGGQETKFGQAMLIAKQILAAKEMIMEMKGTLFTAKQSATKATIKAAESGVDVAGGAAKTAAASPFPANIPLILGYAAQAVGIVSAIKGAMKAMKGASKQNVPTPRIETPTASAGAPESMAPAFNIVGASETNQLADAIGGQTKVPTRAFVVSSDVSTAQEMDRNIIEGASIG
jgi:hypothetical protein